MKKYKIKISPDEMLDYLANARMFIGEGATMAVEAAVLGTPSIYINSLKADNCKDIGEWDLCLSSQDENEILDHVDYIINSKKELFKQKAEDFIQTKIDVTAFTVWFVENYPGSFKIMKENPDYQLTF